ncbi:hypothetical protein POM88_019255 [Heracleum sosnowskyi]|uniref:Uncharacterized protein n=1 Tax=Heracleum sosnowskyi TaxID=360622 RepID=A0AAD8IVG0_9APIA|nr:hypothetical protein POM88_019255 [Heracleum sosnowskyi]
MKWMRNPITEPIHIDLDGNDDELDLQGNIDQHIDNNAEQGSIAPEDENIEEVARDTDDDIIQPTQVKEGEKNGKKKMGKKEDEIAKIRNSPRVFTDMRNSLSDKQREWVIRADFGNLLPFDLVEMPPRLAYKILESFNDMTCILVLQNGDIVITNQDVHDILGLPCQGAKSKDL